MPGHPAVYWPVKKPKIILAKQKEKDEVKVKREKNENDTNIGQRYEKRQKGNNKSTTRKITEPTKVSTGKDI